MNIFIYSDESGVFDKNHYKYFAYGGLVFTNKKEKDDWGRKFLAIERIVRNVEKIPLRDEVKACVVSPKSKSKIYRELKNAEKFGIVVNSYKILDNIFEDKKSKQRYLDWAYKISVKAKLQNLIAQGKIIPNEVDNLYFFVDEHSTTTNGRYELTESLEQEFKKGIYNFKSMTFFPPLFPNLKSVVVKQCNSSSSVLIRAADFVANRIYNEAKNNGGIVNEISNMSIIYHP